MAWDQTKPANNSALTSAEIRANFAALQAALGVVDAVPLSPAVAVQFIGASNFKPGGASTYAAKTSGVVYVNIVDVGNVGAGTDDLMSHALAAGALSTDGKSLIRVSAWGVYAANANAKSLIANFGATAMILRNATANNGASWNASVIVVRNNATSQVMAGFEGTRSGRPRRSQIRSRSSSRQSAPPTTTSFRRA